MFAIVEIAGLQYKVEQDQKLFVNRLAGDKGAKVSFDKVLLTSNGTVTVGAPAVKGIAVEAEILDHVQAQKEKKKRLQSKKWSQTTVDSDSDYFYHWFFRRS